MCRRDRAEQVTTVVVEPQPAVNAGGRQPAVGCEGDTVAMISIVAIGRLLGPAAGIVVGVEPEPASSEHRRKPVARR